MSRDALIIGINHYKYLKLLDSPATDAEAIAQILEHQGGFTINRLPASEDIDAENRSIVTVADSGEITLPELKNALVQLFNPTSQKPPEVALFYFSGHGLREDQGGIQQGFLATTDSETKSYNNCLPLDWLRKLLRNSPVRQQIVWLDCCYSGELFNVAEADPGQRGQGLDRCFIAASRDFEAAIAPRTSDHSLFTEALLQALDYSQSAHGYIDNYQLEENLKQILKTSSFPQQPVYGNSGERPIVLAGWMYATKPAFGENFCPYKGLHYFDNKPEDALFFKGRDKLIAELLTKVKTKPFLAVLGASGNGKSSVVRAGVLYQLQQTEPWQIVNPFTPTADPLTALTNGLGMNEVLTFVQASTKARVILTIDQFEEVFSLCQDPQARDKFFNTLLDAVEQATGKFCLIVIMRADFMDKCSNYPRLARYFQDHQHIVTRPTEDEIQQIIEAPAKQAGFLVEPRLVAEMVTDFKDSIGGLPLLEFALTTLWEKGKADRLLRYADYQVLGENKGINGILNNKATELYNGLLIEEDKKKENLSSEEKEKHEKAQKIAERIFLELIALGEGRVDTRRQVQKDDLLVLSLPYPQPLIEETFNALAKAYLLVVDKPKDEPFAFVNIAHDALIEHWSMLRKWLDQSREDLKLQRQINEGAKAWQAGNKALLVGVDLALAEEYLGTHLERVPLSEVGVEFVKSSQKERDRVLKEEKERQERELTAAKQLAEESEARRKEQSIANQRLKKIVWVLIILFIIACIATGVAWWYREEAKRQRDIGVKRFQGAKSEVTQEYSKALILYQEALELSKNTSDKEIQANGFSDSGRMYKFLNKLPEALKSFEQALDLRHEIGEPNGIKYDERQLLFTKAELGCNSSQLVARTVVGRIESFNCPTIAYELYRICKKPQESPTLAIFSELLQGDILIVKEKCEQCESDSKCVIELRTASQLIQVSSHDSPYIVTGGEEVPSVSSHLLQWVKQWKEQQEVPVKSVITR